MTVSESRLLGGRADNCSFVWLLLHQGVSLDPYALFLSEGASNVTVVGVIGTLKKGLFC